MLQLRLHAIRVLAAASLGACTLALAACGSSNSGSGGGTATSAPSPAQVQARNAAFLKTAECFRTHGLPNFPDPKPGGGFQIQATPQDAPALQKAMQACKHLLPGGGPPSVVPAKVKSSALANAQCMRAHGVPNFPDPQFPAGGGILMRLPSGVNPRSPAFQNAQKACGGPGAPKGGGLAVKVAG